MDEKNDLRIKIVIGVVIALAACAFIPYVHWDTDIVSGRLVSEGAIVERGDQSLAIRLSPCRHRRTWWRQARSSCSKAASPMTST